MPAEQKKKAAAPKKASISVGLNKGHLLAKRKQKERPVHRKGIQSNRQKLIKEVIRDVVGFTPYEKRLMELLRNGLDKRALKLAKRKLGTHRRGKNKWNEMQTAVRKVRENRQKEAEQQKQE
eukprot:TRINITY_DN1001_c0_g1_i1.p1 TRINITY_DN1001_c0_g1~~TRINITY_DN1001_c0_g1_i1.p1  ORF type:complete len:122 (-),score=35.38 TRINITY_DN1001_c0_g1_i1:37-402(-)